MVDRGKDQRNKQVEGKMTSITIYGKSNCPWCDKAKQLAKRYQLDYNYKNISLKKHYDEMKQSVPDVKSVPQIFWNKRYIGGYSEFSKEIENTMGGYGEQLF